MLEIEGRPCISHPLGAHLDLTKDKHGMAKAILKMPYRRRQEDQPSVDYPTDIEEEIRLPFANTIPMLNSKVGSAAAVNGAGGSRGGIEVEDDMGEIDNELFAIPQRHRVAQKTSSSTFSTDFTTTVLGRYIVNAGR